MGDQSRGAVKPKLSASSDSQKESETRAATQVDRPATVSHLLGEITWLFSQSVRHADTKVGDLAWLVMPPIFNRQFQLFRDGNRPVGAALWAFLDEAGEQKVMGGLRAHGKRLEDAEWVAGEKLWLVELVAPFATEANRQAELMIGDLATGPFRGRSFKMLDAAGQVIQVPANAGDLMVRETLEKLRGQGGDM